MLPWVTFRKLFAARTYWWSVVNEPLIESVPPFKLTSVERVVVQRVASTGLRSMPPELVEGLKVRPSEVSLETTRLPALICQEVPSKVVPVLT